MLLSLGDNITATQTGGYVKQFLGFEFSEGLVGLGGLTSGVIQSYNAYPGK